MTLLTASLAAFTFAGGTPSEFTNQLFEESKQPVMVSQAVSVRLPGMEFDPDNINSIFAAFRNSESMIKLPGAEMMFADSMVSPSVLGLNIRLRDGYSARTQDLDESMVEDGKVTIELESDRVIRLEDIADLPFSRPLWIHPALEGLYLSIRVDEMEERDFLIRLAKLVGGHLVSSERQYTILPYAQEFSKRAERTLRASVRDVNANDNDDLIMLQGVETRIAMIREMAPQELLHALDDSVRTEFWMSTKPRATSAFVRWLQMTLAEQEASGRRRRGPNVDLRYVNWQRSTFRVDGRLNLSAEIVMVDPISGRTQDARYTITRTRSSRRGR